MSDDKDREAIKDALVRMVIRTGAEGTTLDDEDRELLRRYGTGEVSYDEMMAFFRKKAALIEGQADRPQ